MTSKQYDKLNAYEDILRLVYFNNTYRGVTSYMLDELADLYIEVSKQRVNRNWSCRSCVFNFLLKVAKLYYAEKQERAKPKPTTATTAKPKSKTNKSNGNKTKTE